MTLWDKGTAAEDWVTRFTVGEDWRWDTLLLPYDIRGTEGHARALHRLGIVSDIELKLLVDTLDALAASARSGDLVVTPKDEDCHTVIERELTERLGDTGQKIHTGRSRNDQVLVALRLYLRDRLRSAGQALVSLIHRLCRLAEEHRGDWMPGYTHLQHAMPTTAGLWAAGFAELLVDDLGLLKEAADRVNVSPWGSAAGYGVPRLDLPRKEFAEWLGFEGIQHNVTSVQLSRGKIEALAIHGIAQISATINRLASDLVLFSSAEFGFVTLPEAYTTGSSIMPQKRNPDVLELARAAHHRIVAELHVLFALPANLPSGYHRDLQLTKEAVMRGVLTGVDLILAVRHIVDGLHCNVDVMRKRLGPSLFATDAALEKVVQGVPFRHAYRETASRLDEIKIPDNETLGVSYAGQGMPGSPETKELRNRLAVLERWCGNDPADDNSGQANE